MTPPTPIKSRREIMRFDADADDEPTVTVNLSDEHADELRELNESDDPEAEMSAELAAAIRVADLERLDSLDDTEDDR